MDALMLSSLLRTEVSMLTSVISGPRGVLTRRTSPHKPRRSTLPLTSRADALSVYDSITPFKGNETTRRVRRTLLPGRATPVISSSPPGNWSSPSLTPLTNTWAYELRYSTAREMRRPLQAEGMLNSRSYQAAARDPRFVSFQVGWVKTVWESFCM